VASWGWVPSGPMPTLRNRVLGCVGVLLVGLGLIQSYAAITGEGMVHGVFAVIWFALGALCLRAGTGASGAAPPTRP